MYIQLQYTTSVIHYIRNCNGFNWRFLNKELFTEQTFFSTLSVSYSVALMDTVNAMCNTTQSSPDSDNPQLNIDACYGCFSRVIEQSKVRKKYWLQKLKHFIFIKAAVPYSPWMIYYVKLQVNIGSSIFPNHNFITFNVCMISLLQCWRGCC
jgi:hypothetical protein